MKNKIRIFIVLAILVALNSCSPLKSLVVHKFEVKNTKGRSLTEYSFFVKVKIENKSLPFTIKSLNGSIRHEDRVIATYQAENIDIKGFSTEDYPIEIKIKLQSVLGFLFSFPTEDELKENLVLDTIFEIKYFGIATIVEEKNIPIYQLLNDEDVQRIFKKN